MINQTVYIIEMQMQYTPQTIGTNIIQDSTEVNISLANYESDTIIRITKPYSEAKTLKIGDKYTLNIDKA